MKYHPDRHVDRFRDYAEKKFKEISEAYNRLSDPSRRKRFDEEHGRPTSRPAQEAQTAQINFNQADELFRNIFGPSAFKRSAGPTVGTTVFSEHIAIKNGKRFSIKTKISKKADGSSVTEIVETPLD